MGDWIFAWSWTRYIESDDADAILYASKNKGLSYLRLILWGIIWLAQKAGTLPSKHTMARENKQIKIMYNVLSQ